MIERIVEKIKEHLINEYYKQTKPNEVYVYEISSCLRRSYYKRKAGIDEINKFYNDYNRLLSIFYGDVMHRFNLIGKSEEWKFKIDDIYLVMKPDEVDGNIIIEKKFTRFIKYRGYELVEPYVTHLNQILTYMAGYYVKNNEIPTGYLVYFGYYDRNIKVFEIKLTQSLIDILVGFIKERVIKYYNHIRNSKEIEGEKSSLCSVCEYKCDTNQVLLPFVQPIIVTKTLK